MMRLPRGGRYILKDRNPGNTIGYHPHEKLSEAP
jgi:hypothetical protein